MIDGTGPKSVEETLQASEKRYRLLFERNMSGVLRTSVDGRVLEANDAFARILGFGSRDDLRDRSMQDLYYRLADREAMLTRLLRDRSLTNYELCLRHKDDSAVWVLANIVVLEEALGPDIIQATITDITERKRVEEALLLFRALIDRSTDAIEVIDPETGRFLDVNETACLAHGYTRDEYLALTVADVAPTADLATWGRNLEQLRRLGSRLHVGWHRRKDGSLFPVEVNITYVRLNRDYIVAVVRDVTERRRAEEELQRTADLLRAVADGTTDAVFVKDRAGKYLLMNEAAARFVGKSVVEVLGKDDTELFDPAGARMIMGADRRVMETGRAETFDEVVTAAGVTRAFQATKAPYRDGAGNVIGLVGVARDITDRRRAEETVRTSEERLRQAVRVTHLGIFDHDHLTETYYWSPEERAIHGWEAERPPNVSEFVTLLHPDDRERIAAAIRRAHDPAGDGTFDVELRIIRPDGEVRWLVIRSQTAFDGDGDARHPVRTVGAVLDVTEWKRVEERLAEAQEIGGFGSFEVDVTTWVGHCSPALRRIFGIETDEPFQNVTDFLRRHIHPDDQMRVELARAKLIDEGGSDKIEVRFLRPDGQERILHLRRRAVRTRAGRVAKLVGTIQDVTELKRLEEQFRQAQKLESLGLLAGGIAHDFNNLLTPVLGYADLLKRRVIGDPEAVRMAESVETAAHAAAELTGQMLAYAGKGRFVIKPLDLSLVVREMAGLLSASASKKAELRYDLRDDLPAIDADPSRVRQVVLNLLTNASESLGEAPGAIQVRTRLIHARPADLVSPFVHESPPVGDYVVLQVSDTGCGMSDETLTRIFDPFFTTKFAGRGLGLAAVLGIVCAHRGTLKVHSVPGQGTMFEVFFPRSARAPEAAPPATAGGGRAAGTVLVAEDEPAIRVLARTILSRAGLGVIEARDGQEAVEVFRKRQADVGCVLLDLTMPRLSGIEALAEIRLIAPAVPVVVMSGYSSEELADRFAGTPLIGIIQKPFRADQLVDLMQKALGISSDH
jgi:PAS domain S-box-containing protein